MQQWSKAHSNQPEKKINRTAENNKNLSIISLHVNGLNSPKTQVGFLD
jgi:hypothetical protein